MVPIPGTTRVSHLKANIAAAGLVAVCSVISNASTAWAPEPA